MSKEIGQLNVVVGLDSTGFQNGVSNLNLFLIRESRVFSSISKNGVDYDFAERAAVEKVNKAANLVQLWNALQSEYFESAVQENIVEYSEAINAVEAPVLVTAAQELLDVANINAVIQNNDAAVNDAADKHTPKGLIPGGFLMFKEVLLNFL